MATISTAFATVSSLLTAGLGETNDAKSLYMRGEFNALVDFVDRVVEKNCFGFIDGLPGTGKSTTLLWSLQRPKHQQRKVIWIHYGREKMVTAMAIKEGGSRTLTEVVTTPMSMEEFSPYYINADVLVIDGVNDDIYLSCKKELVKFWRAGDNAKNKCAFISMSSKIKRELTHERRMLAKKQESGAGTAEEYFTMHSWILDEYMSAFLSNGQKTRVFVENSAIFDQEWDIEVDGAQQSGTKRIRDGRKKMSSVEEVINQKFAYAGGSARWMLQMSTDKIEEEIDDWIQQSKDKMKLLSFSLGPKSSQAKTHLYSSFRSPTGVTKYAMVSERATQLIVDECGTNGIRALYQHALSLQNPSFLGWVVEADLFNRAKSGSLLLKDKHDQSITITCQRGAPIEFDYGYLLQLRKENDVDELNEEVKKLVPGKGSVRTCKPKAWNQGGFDVVFVEVDSSDETKIQVRFGQVTKSPTHSLNLKYFAEFLQFFASTIYEVVSVEIAFVVPLGKLSSFSISSSKVNETGRLSLYTRYGTPHTDDPNEKQQNRWTKCKEHEHIHTYGLDMDGMGYPTTF